jgi:hypothetical protein
MNSNVPATMGIAFLLLCSLSADPRERAEKHPELCQVKTVTVEDTSPGPAGMKFAGDEVKAQLHKRTWLRVADSGREADAVMEVFETDGAVTVDWHYAERRTVISVTLKPQKSDEVGTWRGSAPWGEICTDTGGCHYWGRKDAVRQILDSLQHEAGCKKK